MGRIVGVAVAAMLCLALSGASAGSVGGTGQERQRQPSLGSSIIVTCAPSHTGYDDPIVHPNDTGASHLHLFWANPYTAARFTPPGGTIHQTTPADLQAADLHLATISVPAASHTVSAVLDVPLGATLSWKAPPGADYIYVSGVPGAAAVLDSRQGNTVTVWPLKTVDRLTNTVTFDEPTVTGPYSASGDVTSHIGLTVPTSQRDGDVPPHADKGLTCGGPTPANRGDLTYDTAAYWSPVGYTDQTTAITPVRVRVYYFGAGLPATDCQFPLHLPYAACAADFPGPNPTYPFGFGEVGGSSGATNNNDAVFRNLVWTCGHENALDTPTMSHPYDCTPYKQVPTNPASVDGPVGLVGMPRCERIDASGNADMSAWDPLNPQVVNPDADGGTQDKVCEGNYSITLPRISFRVHFGSAWGGTMTPCTSGACWAYDVSRIEQDPATCQGGTCDTYVFLQTEYVDHLGNACMVVGADCKNWLSNQATTSDRSVLRGTPGTMAGTKYGHYDTAGNDEGATGSGAQILSSVDDTASNYCTLSPLGARFTTCSYIKVASVPQIQSGDATPSCTYSSGTGFVALTDPAFPSAGGGCGSVAGAAWTINLTFAGGNKQNPTKTQKFWTFHSDFWNTWDQVVLDHLFAYCMEDKLGPEGQHAQCTQPGGSNLDNDELINTFLTWP